MSMPITPLYIGNKCSHSQRWREIARLLASGRKAIEICNILQISPGTLSSLFKNPDFQLLLADAQRKRDLTSYDVKGHFKDHIKTACVTVTDMLYNEDVGEKTKLSAAREVLRMAGYGVAPSTVINNQTLNNTTMTFEQRMEQADTPDSEPFPGDPREQQALGPAFPDDLEEVPLPSSASDLPAADTSADTGSTAPTSCSTSTDCAVNDVKPLTEREEELLFVHNLQDNPLDMPELFPRTTNPDGTHHSVPDIVLDPESLRELQALDHKTNLIRSHGHNPIELGCTFDMAMLPEDTLGPLDNDEDGLYNDSD